MPEGGSALQDSAFGYFITACVVILLAIMSYMALPRMVMFWDALQSFPALPSVSYGICFAPQEFFQYYMETNRSRPSADEENKMDLLKKGAAHKLVGV